MKTTKAQEIIRALNEKIKKQENPNSQRFRRSFIIKPKMFRNVIIPNEDLKKAYPIESYIHPSKRKYHTNFEELLELYKNSIYIKSMELEDTILCLEEVYIFYKEKLKKLEKDLEDQNKLYVYRFKKVKEKMEIYKIFEMITDIIFYFTEYIKIREPNYNQKDMYLKKISKAKEITKLKNKEKANTFYRDPNLEGIKFFEGGKTFKELKERAKNNTITKTIEDTFEIQKDCHLIKNNLFDFIPKIELDFDENIEMNEQLFKLLKSELKEILGEDDFSIIEMNKGSFHIIITLQFILKKMKNATSQLINNITKTCKNFIGKIKDFAFFGNKKKVKNSNSLVKSIEDCEKDIIQAFEEKCKGTPINELTNFYELSKSFSINDFNELMNYIQVQNDLQEHEQLLKNFQEYYDIFGSFFDNMLALSVFEYQLVKIYTIDRDDYQTFKINKNNCRNMKEKLLFHGTKPEYIVSILKTFINIGRNTTSKVGKGFYLSDLLDVSWIYSNGTDRIPDVGDSFSVLVVNTYYSESKIEYCYKPPEYREMIVPKDGIRIARAEPAGRILEKSELNNYKGFIQNEYLISHECQMIPLYAINLRRIEYLIIWRDNNFDKSNPNNYDDFDKMLQFNEEIRNYAYREINSKVYYVKNTEEGLRLIDRKKYNKIIIITNGGNNGEEFINESRKILGANSIALVNCYLPSNHLHWISKLSNTFIGHEIDFIKDFLLYSILEKKDKMIELKNRNEQNYNIKLEKFNENELFEFPHFMRDGYYDNLEFIPEYNICA